MTTECCNCNKSFLIEKMFECKICNKEEIKEPKMLCKMCFDECSGCDLRGCPDCLDIACCDCLVLMCHECRNGETLCGCYGKCYWCNRDINRGSDGWPCDECDRWGCHDCRIGNGCKECDPIAKQASNKQLDPNYESEKEEDKEEEPIDEVTILKNKIIELESEILKLKEENVRLLNIRNEPKK